MTQNLASTDREIFNLAYSFLEVVDIKVVEENAHRFIEIFKEQYKTTIDF